MILVFDTNVFLLREGNLWELLEYFPSPNRPPTFLIGLDSNQNILSEYMQYAATVDPEDPMRVVTERILDGSGLFVVQRSCKEIKKSLAARLESLSDDQTIDASLLGVSASFRRGILIHSNTPDDSPIERSFFESTYLQNIEKNGIGPQLMSLFELLRILRQPADYKPDNLDDLDAYLQQYQIADKNSEEREFLEFKCPKCGFLTQELLRKAVAAVCGMLNTREGWVFIGVDDNTGKIKPFPPKYKNSTKDLSIDQLLRDIAAEINRICPRPGKLVNLWAIKDRVFDECVVAIRVHHGNKDYLYRDNQGLGNNMASVKYVRQAAATVEDPDSET